MAFCTEGIRLLSYIHAIIHDLMLHGRMVLCAIECFMEMEVWPITHSVRLCSIKHSKFFDPSTQVTLYLSTVILQQLSLLFIWHPICDVKWLIEKSF